MLPYRSAAKWAAVVGAAVLCTALFTNLAGSAVAHVPKSDAAGAVTAGTAIHRPEFADIIEMARPAVVTVSVEKQARPQRLEFGYDSAIPEMDGFLRRFFGNRPNGGERRMMPGMPPSAAPGPSMRGMGSGFIIDAGEGLIVTNNHVISGAETVVVTLDDGTEHDAAIVGVDAKTDLALLRITAADLQAVEFGDSDAARIGDWVVAIGNPFGLGGTATVGIISARGRDIQSGPYDDYLQIDAPINQGNSGGPIFDTNGHVIGVNTAIYSPNGGNVGIGFAIPASQVEAVVRQLAANGVVERGWLGVQLQQLSQDIASSLGLGSAEGALVVAVVPDAPAEAAGIEVGDVIVEFADQPVDSAKTLSRQVGATSSNSKVTIKVWRDGAYKTLRVKLGQADAPTVASVNTEDSAEDAVSGMRLAALDDPMRRRLGVAEDVTGVVVTGVDPGGRAAKEGLRPGDIILRVDRRSVATPEDVTRTVKELRQDNKDAVLLLVRRGDTQHFTALSIG